MSDWLTLGPPVELAVCLELCFRHGDLSLPWAGHSASPASSGLRRSDGAAQMLPTQPEWSHATHFGISVGAIGSVGAQLLKDMLNRLKLSKYSCGSTAEQVDFELIGGVVARLVATCLGALCEVNLFPRKGNASLKIGCYWQLLRGRSRPKARRTHAVILLPSLAGRCLEFGGATAQAEHTSSLGRLHRCIQMHELHLGSTQC